MNSVETGITVEIFNSLGISYPGNLNKFLSTLILILESGKLVWFRGNYNSPPAGYFCVFPGGFYTAMLFVDQIPLQLCHGKKSSTKSQASNVVACVIAARPPYPWKKSERACLGFFFSGGG